MSLPSVVTVLLDPSGKGQLPPNVFIGTAASASAFNPETISIAALVIGMILIALVSVGGFTVLAQRRLRSFGMLESLGATDRHVSLVVRANGAANPTVETKNGAPTSVEITNYATVFGIALALAILAMSVGLIRSETASDLRTLTATGTSSRMRRTLTATTAGALALVGAVLGTGAGYLAVIGYMRSNTFEGGLSALGGAVPVWDLVGILVAMPVVAAIGGWLLGGRQPPGVARQPIE